MIKAMTFILSLSFFSCSWFRPDGEILGASAKSNIKSIIAIGVIENRDYRFTTYVIKNFHDMLEFQFVKNGYQLLELNLSDIYSVRKQRPNVGLTLLQERDLFDEEPASTGDDSDLPNEKKDLFDEGPGQESKEKGKESKSPEKMESTPSPKRKPLPANDKTYNENRKDLLPKKFRRLAGEAAPNPPAFANTSYYLNSKEIQKLAKKNRFDFFIQGAVGNNDSGTLLDEDYNSLAFLRVYNKRGTLVGVINFSVNGRTFFEAPFLKEVCARIVKEFAKQID